MKFFGPLLLGLLLATQTARADVGFEVGPFRLGFFPSERHYYRSDDGEYYYSDDGYYYRNDDRRYHRADNYRYRAAPADYRSIRVELDSPICYAISNQKRLEMVVNVVEEGSSGTKNLVTRKLVVEPHAFGTSNQGDPILKGTVVSDERVRQVALTDERRTEEPSSFSGLFTSQKNATVDIRRVVKVTVIENSHFDMPTDFKGMDEAEGQVICQLPVSQ